ncbi:hypothetical protein HCN44_005956 [Aphidius gifuensis]|uniref:Uncharacterized protein n=1 Tax=Aphidius gifuensis TaxID=684658 RepID=A0A834Y2D7_APHGI|nr:hypothetical protein HCN44_005956 [Aphidius gifuensis]
MVSAIINSPISSSSVDNAIASNNLSTSNVLHSYIPNDDSIQDKLDSIISWCKNMTPKQDDHFSQQQKSNMKQQIYHESMYDTFKVIDSKFKLTENKMKDLENQIASINKKIFNLQVEKKNPHDTSTSASEGKNTWSNEVVLFGISEIANENLQDIVTAICNSINFNCTFIVSTSRLEKLSAAVRPVRIQFISMQLRESFITLLKKKGKFPASSLNILSLSHLMMPLFVYRRSPKYLLDRKDILTRLPFVNPKDVWISFNKVNVRLNNGSPIILKDRFDLYLLPVPQQPNVFIQGQHMIDNQNQRQPE